MSFRPSRNMDRFNDYPLIHEGPRPVLAPAKPRPMPEATPEDAERLSALFAELSKIAD